jgi:hypothetical protein
MLVHELIRHSARPILSEQTKCDVMNALIKYRRDLKTEMSKVVPRDTKDSVAFLKKYGMWDEEANRLMSSVRHWQIVHEQGPDDWSQDKVTVAQNRLMCHLVGLIRQSTPA